MSRDWLSDEALGFSKAAGCWGGIVIKQDADLCGHHHSLFSSPNPTLSALSKLSSEI